jgi:hypothetical protein
MIRICSWHHGTKPFIIEEIDPLEDKRIKSSICPECKHKMLFRDEDGNPVYRFNPNKKIFEEVV